MQSIPDKNRTEWNRMNPWTGLHTNRNGTEPERTASRFIKLFSNRCESMRTTGSLNFACSKIEKKILWIGASGASGAVAHSWSCLRLISRGQGLRAPNALVAVLRARTVFGAFVDFRTRWKGLQSGDKVTGRWRGQVISSDALLHSSPSVHSFFCYECKCIHSYHSCRWCGLMKQLPKCKTWKIRLDPSAWAPSKNCESMHTHCPSWTATVWTTPQPYVLTCTVPWSTNILHRMWRALNETVSNSNLSSSHLSHARKRCKLKHLFVLL